MFLYIFLVLEDLEIIITVIIFFERDSPLPSYQPSALNFFTMERLLTKASQFKLILILLAISVLFVTIHFKTSLSPEFKINEVSFKNNDGENTDSVVKTNFSIKNGETIYLVNQHHRRGKWCWLLRTFYFGQHFCGGGNCNFIQSRAF